MKKRLLDFSCSTAITVCLAYAFLLSLSGFMIHDSVNKTVPIIVFSLIALSFMLVFVYFVILSPVITKTELKHGSKKIKKKNIRYKAAYDKRLREKIIVFWDKKVEIKYLSDADYKKKTIRVQATDANLRKVGQWLECEIPSPEKPTRKKLFQRK